MTVLITPAKSWIIINLMGLIIISLNDQSDKIKFKKYLNICEMFVLTTVTKRNLNKVVTGQTQYTYMSAMSFK